jgi:hypothetical protein
MRFRNNDVLSSRDGVLTIILEALLQEWWVWPAPHPTLSPQVRGEGVRDRRESRPAPYVSLSPRSGERAPRRRSEEEWVRGARPESRRRGEAQP